MGPKQSHIADLGLTTKNGIAERYIRTMVEKARTALNNAHAHNDINTPIDLWIFAMHHVANQWNATPSKYLWA